MHTHRLEIKSMSNGITCKFIFSLLFKNNWFISNQYLAYIYWTHSAAWFSACYIGVHYPILFLLQALEANTSNPFYKKETKAGKVWDY